MHPSSDSLVVVERPWSWAELAAVAVVGAAAGFLFGMYVAASTVYAGDVVVTFTQTTDCAEVEEWEVLALPNPQASPAPNVAPVVALIKNGPPLLCAPGPVTRTINVPTLGATRFWVRAVNASGMGAPGVSKASNARDADVPLAPPAGLTVVVP